MSARGSLSTSHVRQTRRELGYGVRRPACILGFAYRALLLGVLTVVHATLTGCRTIPPLPPANLAAPGWQVHQGQAVWKLKSHAPEVVGELLVALRNDGETFLQFTKSPFPFAIARTTTNSWQIEFPAVSRFYAGRGKPPARPIWLQVGRWLQRETLPARYQATYTDSEHWRLENTTTGESLEGYFYP